MRKSRIRENQWNKSNKNPTALGKPPAVGVFYAMDNVGDGSPVPRKRAAKRRPYEFLEEILLLL